MNKREIDSLLQRTANGDHVAFEELYARTRRGVFAFLYTYLHNYADAEDAMQTVYLKIKNNVLSYRVGSNGLAWILQIAKNYALNELRRTKRTVSLDEVGEIACQTEFKTGDVTHTMEQVLSEEEQRIVTLHVLWKYKHREIGELLGCPTGMVLSKYKRAVKKLKEALKEEEK